MVLPVHLSSHANQLDAEDLAAFSNASRGISLPAQDVQSQNEISSRPAVLMDRADHPINFLFLL
jgi:hypothetical protein